MVEYGVQEHRGPKHPTFKSIDSRQRSYQTQSSIAISTETLSEAGFFSIGQSDYVKCFYCGGRLCNWELGDDPWVEHAKWFPECHFVELKKSEAFIDECKRLAGKDRTNDRINNENEDSDKIIDLNHESLEAIPISISSSNSYGNRLLCKICLDHEIEVVFLTCGHQLTCTQCALALNNCPICRQVIRGTVRTFFS
jgi:hypothetical protein